MVRCKIFYKFGLPEKSLFKKDKELYDGIAINANVAKYYYKSIPEFLKKLQKPYFIDPVTYVFGRELGCIKKNGRIKKSYEKLIGEYGPTLSRMGGRIKLEPAMFNSQFIEELSQYVIKFQKNYTTKKTKKKSPMARYESLIGVSESDVEGPHFLVSPYFYASSITDPWYDVSLKLALKSKEFKGNYDLYPVISISNEILIDENSRKKIESDYANFDGCLLWISNFRERVADSNSLKALIDLVSNLSKNGHVYMLYGGYFSITLSKFGLAGFCSGICYGESKDVDAIPGGIPLSRYYVIQTKNMVPEAGARTFYGEFEYEDLLCKCQICEPIKTGAPKGRLVETFFNQILDQFPGLSKKHFLHARMRECKDIESTLLEELSKKFESEYDYFHKKLRSFMYKGFNVSHLQRWAEVFQT